MKLIKLIQKDKNINHMIVARKNGMKLKGHRWNKDVYKAFLNITTVYH